MRLFTNNVAMFPAMLALTVMFVITPRVARAQDGSPYQTNPGYSEAPVIINPDTIDDAALKQTAKAYVKVERIVQKRQQALNSTSDEAKRQQIAEQAEAK
jgi:hypothetical protein